MDSGCGAGEGADHQICSMMKSGSENGGAYRRKFMEVCADEYSTFEDNSCIIQLLDMQRQWNWNDVAGLKER